MNIHINGRDRVLVRRLKKVLEKRKNEQIKYEEVASQLSKPGKWKALSSFLKNNWSQEKINKIILLRMPIKSFKNKTKDTYVLSSLTKFDESKFSSARLLLADKNDVNWTTKWFSFSDARTNNLRVFITEENQAKIIGILMGLEDE